MKAIFAAFLVALFGGFLAIWLLSAVLWPPNHVPASTSDRGNAVRYQIV
jgi:hypothetical protein